MRKYHVDCGKFYDSEYIFNSDSDFIARCSGSGIIELYVDPYEKGLDYKILNNSIKAILKYDLLTVAEISLTISFANGLVNYFRGENLALTNRNSAVCDQTVKLVM